MKPQGCTIAGIPVMLPRSKLSGASVVAGLDVAVESVASASSLGAGFDAGRHDVAYLEHPAHFFHQHRAQSQRL